ncbi:MAG: serine O-acetyltransferase [bacterium]|nr:serine O-acetyltransferase [bacterium]
MRLGIIFNVDFYELIKKLKIHERRPKIITFKLKESINGVRLCRQLLILGKQYSEVRLAIKKDKEALKRLDPAFETPYQYLFHAGFQSLKLYRYSHMLYETGFKLIAFAIYHLARILYGVDIHPAAVIKPGVVIDHGVGLVIGSTAVVGSGTVLYHGVTLGSKNLSTGKRHPTLGRNVFVGAGAKILGPVKIGDGAKIGANSVVLNDVPENATAVGIPAKIIIKTTPNSKNSDDLDHLCEDEESHCLCLNTSHWIAQEVK